MGGYLEAHLLGIAGGGGYEIPADVHALLDQLRALAEDLGLPQEGKEAVEEPPTQPGEEKPQKKLPPQLNPLLAKLARTAARENDKSSGKYCFRMFVMLDFLGRHQPSHQSGNLRLMSQPHQMAYTSDLLLCFAKTPWRAFQEVVQLGWIHDSG